MVAFSRTWRFCVRSGAIAIAILPNDCWVLRKNERPEMSTSPLFSDAEKVALEYADAITDTYRDVDDELFARLQQYYDDDTVAELTMIIAWENASSRFNRAFRIPSQEFWKR